MLQFEFINYCLYLRPCKSGAAGVVELVDTLDLGSSAARCESSSLSARTQQKSHSILRSFFCAGGETRTLTPCGTRS